MAAVADGEHQVLEFELAGKTYCVSLDLVDEIVNNENAITEIPNSAPAVIGVMDLRGRTTTIVDPRLPLDLPTGNEPKYVIVFESAGEPVGWLIEEVTQVASRPAEDVDESVATETVRGVFKRDGEFTIWVDPGDILT